MKRVRGSSFIEVMFAVFIVALCGTIVVVTMPIANTSRARADYLNKATGVAQKQLEAIRGLGYPNATATQLTTFGLIDGTGTVAADTYSFTNVDSVQRDEVSRVLPNGTGTVKLEQVELDLRRVTVTVNWKEQGKNRTYSVGTLIANL